MPNTLGNGKAEEKKIIPSSLVDFDTKPKLVFRVVIKKQKGEGSAPHIARGLERGTKSRISYSGGEHRVPFFGEASRKGKDL